MAVHSNHPQTIRLDHCWVCAVPFVDKGGTANREIHHVIPVAYGGVDGPTVDLCDTHHTCLHKVAVAIYAGKPYHNLFGDADPGQRKKLMWLAQQVNNARTATLGDPNKKLEVTLPINASRKKKLEALAKVYPQLKSRQSIFLFALDELYNRHFLK